jgi:hypothetical protein
MVMILMEWKISNVHTNPIFCDTIPFLETAFKTNEAAAAVQLTVTYR